VRLIYGFYLGLAPYFKPAFLSTIAES